MDKAFIIKDSPTLVQSAEGESSGIVKDVVANGDAATTDEVQTPSSDTKSPAPLRRGKWTVEEEQYANRLIQEFKAGLLPLTDGTTLRTFLSRLLNCDPMRISKKFVGSNCIGKQVFRRRSAEIHKLTPEQIARTRMDLCELEKMFLDRLSEKSSGKGGRGGGSGGGKSFKNTRMVSLAVPSLGGAGLGGSLGGMSNANKSAAALGRAMLGGKNEAGETLAQNQRMLPLDPASFLNLGSQAGGLGNINPNTSLSNLMLQSGMTRDQISMLAATGLTSSASLANLLMKQRSIDQHLNMDFQSMQSFDDLASMIQAGMPNQANLPNAQMKNVDWGSEGIRGAGVGNMVNPGIMSYAGQQPTVSAAAVTSGLMNINNNVDNANYGNLIQNTTVPQGRHLAGGQVGGTTTSDINSYIQSLASQKNQQQQVPAFNYGSLLQGYGGSSFLQNNSQYGASIGNTAQAQIFRPFMQNLQNDSFAGASQGNPMLIALAQQQLLAQAGGYGQQSSFPGLAGGMNNSLGRVESSYGANPDASQLALFQQLMAQQSSGLDGGVGLVQGLAQNGDENLSALSGNKRISECDEDGGTRKKQQTAFL